MLQINDNRPSFCDESINLAVKIAAVIVTYAIVVVVKSEDGIRSGNIVT